MNNIPLTSLEAFQKIQSTLNRRQFEALKAVRSQPNVIEREIAYLLKWEINRVTGRRERIGRPRSR